MKNFVRPAVSVFAVLMLFAAFAGTNSVRADNENGQGQKPENHGSVVSQVARENEGKSDLQSTQESVSLRTNGDFTVTGAKVNSVDATSNSVNVTFYGFTRTVSLSGATISGGGQTIAIGDIQVGDVLSGSGNFNESTHVISLSRVVDVSFAARNTSNIQSQINNLLQLVQQLQAQLKAMQSH